MKENMIFFFVLMAYKLMFLFIFQVRKKYNNNSCELNIECREQSGLGCDNGRCACTKLNYTWNPDRLKCCKPFILYTFCLLF